MTVYVPTTWSAPRGKLYVQSDKGRYEARVICLPKLMFELVKASRYCCISSRNRYEGFQGCYEVLESEGASDAHGNSMFR